MAETDRYALGLKYTMEAKLSQLIPKDEAGKPIVSDKVYVDDARISYVDSGPIDVVITNNRTGREEVRSIRSDFGTPLGQIPLGTNLDQNEVYTETGRRLTCTRGKAEEITISLRTDTHLNTRISAVSQGGTLRM